MPYQNLLRERGNGSPGLPWSIGLQGGSRGEKVDILSTLPTINWMDGDRGTIACSVLFCGAALVELKPLGAIRSLIGALNGAFLRDQQFVSC